MIRTILKPEKESLHSNCRIDLAGKIIEVTAFCIEDSKAVVNAVTPQTENVASLKDFTFNSYG